MSAHSAMLSLLRAQEFVTCSLTGVLTMVVLYILYYFKEHFLLFVAEDYPLYLVTHCHIPSDD
jgi:hypothetical protein